MDFITEIKKINTDGLILRFAERSIEMFKAQESTTKVEIPVLRYGRSQRLCVALSAWDIPSIDYLAVKHSNDYRDGKKKCSVEQLVNLYRDYDNEHHTPDALNDPNLPLDNIFRIILGMTAEQFQHSRMLWAFERFSRNYYILLAAKDFKHRALIDVDGIVKETFGYGANDYIAVLFTIFWLCLQNPLPLNAPSTLYHRKESSVLTEENIKTFVAQYTCTYGELRDSPLEKQLLYSKPFIKTQKTGITIMSSMYLVAMLIGNGLYWVVRDYYREKKQQTFVNAFGLLFEDYITDLANTYCSVGEWRYLEEGRKKQSDFYFDFGSARLIVEAKSALLGLDGRQQVPNTDTIDRFYRNTIQEAYQQLQSSYSELFPVTPTPLLKIILLYDEFSNTAIIEQSISEMFLNDPICYIMTVRDFEILLYTHKHNYPQFKNVLNSMAHPKEDGRGRKCVTVILEEYSLTDNLHLEGEMDYFKILLKHFGNQLK